MTFSPGLRWVLHHRQHGVVVLLILVVEEHQLSPQVCLFNKINNVNALVKKKGKQLSQCKQNYLFGGTEHFGDIDARPKEF